MMIFILGRLILTTDDFTYIVFLEVCCTRTDERSKSRGQMHLHYALQGGGKAPKGINLGEAHRKHAYQLMANELKIGHVKVSLLYMALQLVVSIGFVFVCPLASEALGIGLVACHWIYLVAALVVLAVVYLLFMKKYYHLHEEYLAGLKG